MALHFSKQQVFSVTKKTYVLFVCLRLMLTQYEEFWADPTAISIMWLGLLFSMLCLATQFQQLLGSESADNSQTSQSPQDIQ